MSLISKIFKNTASLIAAELVGQVMSFFLIVYIARYLGDVGLGKYSFVYAFTGLFFMLADLGLFGLSVRNIAKNKKEAKKYMDNVSAIKLFLGIISLALTMIAIIFTDASHEIWFITLLAGTATFLTTYNKTWIIGFRAYEKMHYEAIVKIVERIIISCLGIYLIIKGYGLIGLNLAIVGGYFTSLIISCYISNKKIIRIGLSFDFKFWKFLLTESYPFWFIGIFEYIYFRIDVVMLSVMKDYAVTGWYNAAYRIIDVLIKVPLLVSSALYPTMSRLHTESLVSLKILYQKVIKYLLVLSFPAVVGGVILASDLIMTIYNNQFINSIFVLQILILSLFFVFVNYFIGNLLMAIDMAKIFTVTSGICALFNVLLNFALIPSFSYIGAAVATVLTEALNFVLLYYFASKKGYTFDILKTVYKPIIASVVMGAFLLSINFKVNFVLKIIFGALVYFVILILLKGIGKEEINYFKEILKNRKATPIDH